MQRRDLVVPVEGGLEEEFVADRHRHHRIDDAVLFHERALFGEIGVIRGHDLLRLAEREHRMDRNPAFAVAAQHAAHRAERLRAHHLRHRVLDLDAVACADRAQRGQRGVKLALACALR